MIIVIFLFSSTKFYLCDKIIMYGSFLIVCLKINSQSRIKDIECLSYAFIWLSDRHGKIPKESVRKGICKRVTENAAYQKISFQLFMTHLNCGTLRVEEVAPTWLTTMGTIAFELLSINTYPTSLYTVSISIGCWKSKLYYLSIHLYISLFL